MGGNPEQTRKSIRYRDHDYSSSGAYFITICSQRKQNIFGEIVGEELRPNALGQIVHDEWIRSGGIRREIELDEFVLMPNHIHGIVFIHRTPYEAAGAPPLLIERPQASGRRPLRLPARSLGAFVAGFKSASAKRINISRRSPGTPVWQRNYYERVIRNEKELNAIRKYIIANPTQWVFDRDNPQYRHVVGGA